MYKHSQKLPLSNIIIGIIFISLALLSIVAINSYQKTNQIENLSIMQKHPRDIFTIPPLYPGLEWEEGSVNHFNKHVLRIWEKDRNIFDDISLKGKYWTSVTNDESVDIAAYYRSLLQNAGWKTQIILAPHTIETINADGPTGGMFGVVREDGTLVQNITVFLDIIPSIIYEDGPSSCPCTYRHTVFISEPTAISEIIAIANFP